MALKFKYDFAMYHKDINNYGLQLTWEKILNQQTDEILDSVFWSDYYEEGLAYLNKNAKKEKGQYYTPADVANVMADFYVEFNGQNICDICCGTGNLILSVFQLMTKEKVRQVILQHNLYLYDIDKTALMICKALICNEYGTDLEEHINVVIGDFLNPDIHLPKNARVISNPPYGKLAEPYNTIIQKTTKELYSSFIEKIVLEAEECVIISPHSYMGGNKFADLRSLLRNYRIDIYSFDNVPCNIFNGVKKGIFNSNSANSVRASILVKYNNQKSGIKVSEFLRFETAERAQILNKVFLRTTLNDDINSANSEGIFYRLRHGSPVNWLNSKHTVKDLCSKEPTAYEIITPNSCRYYMCGVKRNLSRTGKYTLYAKDEDSFYILYGILNSSYCYYFQRATNGGITYPMELLMNCPIPEQKDIDMMALRAQVDKMIKEEDKYLTLKKNAGVYQENVKFSEKYRQELNNIFSPAFGEDKYDFVGIHSNKYFIE